MDNRGEEEANTRGEVLSCDLYHLSREVTINTSVYAPPCYSWRRPWAGSSQSWGSFSGRLGSVTAPHSQSGQGHPWTRLYGKVFKHINLLHKPLTDHPLTTRRPPHSQFGPGHPWTHLYIQVFKHLSLLHKPVTDYLLHSQNNWLQTRVKRSSKLTKNYLIPKHRSKCEEMFQKCLSATPQKQIPQKSNLWTML